MLKLFGLKGQVLELRGLLEQKEREIYNLNARLLEIDTKRKYWRDMYNTSNRELIKVRDEFAKLNLKNKFLLSKNESYLADLIKYEKEIKELNEQLTNQKEVYGIYKNAFIKLKEQNKCLWNQINNTEKEDNQIVKHYLIEKYKLLADQKAPTLLLELIDNLIQELKNE